MSKGQNQYSKDKKRQSLLGSITAEQNTKDNLAGSGIETLKDVAIGGILGGVAGAAAGRFSFLGGAAVTFLGHLKQNRLAKSIGVGMMASSAFQTASQSQVSGIEKGGLEGAKERVMAFKDSLSQKLFLDKLLKKKAASTTTTNGVGEVQYFVYPNTQPALESDMDFSALNRLENQIAQSASSYQKSVAGTDMGGLGDLNDEGRHY